MLGIYQKFSENLMAQTVRRGSIADACRALGINRQQFNKYLSGTVLPSAQTLAKITAHFNVTDIELFIDENAKLHNTAAAPQIWPEGLVDGASQCELAEGVYGLYAPWILDPKKLSRSVMVVRRQKGAVTFERFVRLRATLASDGASLDLQLHGIVLQSRQQILFVGRETMGWNNYFACYAFNLENRSVDEVYPGILLLYLPTGLPVSVNTLLVRLGNLDSASESQNEIGIFDQTDLSLPSAVRRFFEMRGAEMSHLHCVDALQEIRRMSN
jgi:transcriptional regulator with XRE-family HTH domain